MNLGNYIACAAGGALLGSVVGPKGATIGAVVGVVSIGLARKLDKVWQQLSNRDLGVVEIDLDAVEDIE